MKIYNFKTFLIGSFLSLILGVILGIILSVKQPIEIDHKIRYSELLNWLTTIVIGFFIGYILRNQYENSKTIKSYIIDDVKVVLLELHSVSELFAELKNQARIDEDNRREINSRMNVIDKKIAAFCGLLEDAYKTKHEPIKHDIVNKFNAYNKSITGDGFYNPNYIYFDDVVAQSTSFEIFLRKLIFKIIKEL